MLLGIIGFFAFMAVIQTVVLEVRGEPAGYIRRCSSRSSWRSLVHLAAAAQHRRLDLDWTVP